MKSNTMSLEQFKDKHYGKAGNPRRDALEYGFEKFKVLACINEVLVEKGLTQGQLAGKIGGGK